MSTTEEKAAYWHAAVSVIRDVEDEMEETLDTLMMARTSPLLAAKIERWRDLLISVCP
jgi:hypothetical protein